MRYYCLIVKDCSEDFYKFFSMSTADYFTTREKHKWLIMNNRIMVFAFIPVKIGTLKWWTFLLGIP